METTSRNHWQPNLFNIAKPPTLGFKIVCGKTNAHMAKNHICDIVINL